VAFFKTLLKLLKLRGVNAAMTLLATHTEADK
jgi:hypothetical protein